MKIQSLSRHPLFWYIVAIILGVLSGVSGQSFIIVIATTIADLFVNLFKCISLPIIALSLIVTLSHQAPTGRFAGIWRRTLLYTFGTTFIAALVSAWLYVVIHPSLSSEWVTMPRSGEVLTGYGAYLRQLIPSNLIAPFVEQRVLSVLFIGIVTGIGIRYIPDPEAQAVVKTLFRGLHGLMMVLTRWVVALLPIGLYGFITTTVLQWQQGAHLKGIGAYLCVVVLANIVQGFIVLPLWLRSHGLRPFVTMRAMLPALSLAFFSKSSVGTLPVTMETAEKNLNISPAVSRFVLPLCTSLNMNGCAAFIFATVMYVMQHHGLAVSYPMMGLWVVIATIAAIGNAGVPMGCFFLSASLLASMNVPITMLGIILPFYGLIDMFETALNVWSDACVATVVDQGVTEGEVASEPGAVEV